MIEITTKEVMLGTKKTDWKNFFDLTNLLFKRLARKSEIAVVIGTVTIVNIAVFLNAFQNSGSVNTLL
jgi:hypothetical protein